MQSIPMDYVAYANQRLNHRKALLLLLLITVMTGMISGITTWAVLGALSP
jgi:hypothetical protein